MAYKKTEIEKLALAAIEKYRPITVEELIAYIPISESTFYKWKLQATGHYWRKRILPYNRSYIGYANRYKGSFS